MKRQQAYKFELRPNGPQANLMAQFASCRRFVFNKALAAQNECYGCTGKKLTYPETCKLLPIWKKDPEFAWLALAPSQTLQQTLKDLERGFQNFFGKTSAHPTFKKKGKSNESFRYPAGFEIDEAKSIINLPKLGWMRYRKSSKIEGVSKNVTVSYAAGKWVVSIQTEREFIVPEPIQGYAVAADRGIAIFAALSDGNMIDPVNAGKKAQKAMRKAQRTLSRRKRGSIVRSRFWL